MKASSIKNWGLGILFVAASTLLLPVVAFADVNVSIGVGDTIIDASGYTAPNALVEIKENGVTLNSVASDSNGYFSALLNAQQSGIRDISFIATTLSFTQTDEITININLLPAATTSISVFLPPTVQLNTNSLDQGDNLVVSGYGRPGSTMIINIDNGGKIVQTTTNGSGLWQISINTSSLNPGSHSLYVLSQFGVGNFSYPTQSRNFTLFDVPDSGGGTGSPSEGGSTGGGSQNGNGSAGGQAEDEDDVDKVIINTSSEFLLASVGVSYVGLVPLIIFSALTLILSWNIWLLFILFLLLGGVVVFVYFRESKQ